MKTLKEIVDEKLVDTVRVDLTMDERYGDKPLFPHKIERIKALLKGTVLDPAVKPTKAEQENSPTPV